MTDRINISREKNPSARIPEDKQEVVWRYMPKWKFVDLVKRKQIHLCRADRLQDRFEGTYSRHQIMDMNQWYISKGYEEMIHIDKIRRQSNRQRYYINSWCMSQYDLDLMWKAYANSTHAVAIKSNVYRLETICDAAVDFWPLDVSIVEYLGHTEGHFIDYFANGFDAFIHKDYHFELDREIRLIHYRTYKPSQPESILLPVDLSILIEKVVLAPDATYDDEIKIRKLLDQVGLCNLAVEATRNTCEVLY